MIPPKQIEQNKEKIIELLKSTKREGIENLIKFLETSDFFESPASTKHHGNYKGALAYHSLLVYEEFYKQVENFGLDVNEDSAIIAGICHDACKINTYVENRLESGKISDKKPYKIVDDFPFGHGEKSVFVTQKYIELTNQEAMLIRWHMGPYDDSWSKHADYVEKTFPEAVLFHHADKQVALYHQV